MARCFRPETDTLLKVTEKSASPPLKWQRPRRCDFKFTKARPPGRTSRLPRFSHSGYFQDPQWAAPKNFTAAMGMPIRKDGSNDAENLNLATRNALLQMIDILQERGYSKEQAYCICSVAVDLRISNVRRCSELRGVRIAARKHLRRVNRP